MDNRLGGGKLRSSVASYLDDHVSRLLTAGSYQEETGRQLAAACGELSQLAGFLFADAVFARSRVSFGSADLAEVA